MNTQKRTILTFHLSLSFGLSLIALLSFSISTWAQSNACQLNDGYAKSGGFSSGMEKNQDYRAWRVVASTGAVDPNDLNKVVLGAEGTVTLKPGATEAVLRYNIAKEIGTFIPAVGQPYIQGFRVRYFKPNADSRVLILLKSYNLKNGQSNTLATFDSNECDSAVSANYQWRTKSFKRTDNPDMWGDQAYFLEVHLIRTTNAGNPGLGIIMVGQLYF